LRRRARLPRARRDPPFGDRDAEAAEELLALVLVEVHGARRTLTMTTLAPPSGGDVNRSCDAVISFLRPMGAERRGLTVDCMQSTSGGTLMTPSPFVVETAGLTKRFGDRTVVRDVELQVPRGSAFGYLGPNGAGKTTLIRMLLGLTRATSGSMHLLGLPVPQRRSEALARVGAIVEEPRFHRFLTGRENLEIVAAARGHEATQRIDATIVIASADNGRAGHLLGAHAAVDRIASEDGVLRVQLRSIDERVEQNAVADINRRLVEAGIPVYRLEPEHASLERRFLEITSR